MRIGGLPRTPAALAREIRRRWRRRQEDLRLLDEELRHHIEERIDALVAAGMSRDDARRHAQGSFGSLERVRRDCRTARRRGEVEVLWRRLPDQLLHELRIALRTIRQAPGFSAAVILTLALGVGANTAVYSVVDAVLLRPLPYEDPDRLMHLYPYDVETGRTQRYLAANLAEAWRQALGDEALTHGRFSAIRSDGDQAVSISLEAVRGHWLEVLGAAPALGRGFLASEVQPGAGDVVMVSHEFWRSALGADPNVLGRTLRLDGRAVRIVGVMPRGFEFPATMPTAAWTPLASDGSALGRSSDRFGFELVARVPEGVDPAVFEARLNSRVLAMASAFVEESGREIRLAPYDDFRANRDVRRALLLVTAAVGLMLLIAIVNVVNLLLARGASRRDELRVRAALGASRGRIIAQVLTETTLLALVAGTVALGFAEGLRGAIVGLLPGEITFFLVGEVEIDRRVFVYALSVTLAAGLAAGLLPALRLARGVAGVRGTGRRQRLNGALVVAEVALTLVLLIATGLFARSFLRLTSVDPGFAADRILNVAISAPESRYADGAARGLLFRELRDSIARLPGVESVTIAQGTPPDSGFYVNVRPQAEDGEPLGPVEMLANADVEPGFFETVGSRLVAGRAFTDTEGPEDRVAILEPDLARALWGDTRPLGRRFRVDEDAEWTTVVGVVEDIKMRGLDDRDATFAIFLPLRTDEIDWPYNSLLVRTAGDPTALVGSVRDAVREIDPVLPIASIQTGRESIAETIEKPRFLLRLMLLFGALSLLLAGVGIYAVLAFAVRERRRELGVRAALGADAVHLRRGVLRDGLGKTAIGAVVGMAAWWAIGRVVQSLLYVVDAHDPGTLAATALITFVAAALACWIPATRATRIEPAEILRAD